MSKGTHVSLRRIGSLVAIAAVAGALVVAAAAWACTAYMGPMTLSPNSGKPGTVIRANASGLKPSSTYKLVFNNAFRVRSNYTCHTSPVILRSGVQTSTSGAFSTTATIPTNAPRGTSQVCGIETAPVAGATATTHTGFTVL